MAWSEIFRKTFKILPKTGKVTSVLSKPEISLDAPIKIECVRANKQFQLVDNDAQRTVGQFLNHSTAWHPLIITCYQDVNFLRVSWDCHSD